MKKKIVHKKLEFYFFPYAIFEDTGRWYGRWYYEDTGHLIDAKTF